MTALCLCAKLIGTGKIYGYKLKMFNHATIVPHHDALSGAIWLIPSENIGIIDMFENCPEYYIKVPVSIYTVDDQRLRNNWIDAPAFTYVMQRAFHKGYPSKEYIDMCIEGYRENKLPMYQLYVARL
jgi:gamma-glutamylcyclotransferase (GGCT)/AIG2-like uncharacterized protein YtfP